MVNRQNNRAFAWVSTFTLLSFYYLMSQAAPTSQNEDYYYGFGDDDGNHTNATTTTAPPVHLDHDGLSFVQIMEIIGLSAAGILLFCAICCCWRKYCADRDELDLSEGGGWQGFKENMLCCFFSTNNERHEDTGFYYRKRDYGSSDGRSRHSAAAQRLIKKYNKNKQKEGKNQEDRAALGLTN